MCDRPYTPQDAEKAAYATHGPLSADMAGCPTTTAKETPGCRLLKEAGRVGDTAREVWERAAGLEGRLLTSEPTAAENKAQKLREETPESRGIGLLDDAADRVQDASRTLDLTLAILVRLEDAL